MRFRVLRKGKARHFSVPEKPAPQPSPAPPRAADLDNPYGRCYGRARSREDLRKK